MREDDSMLRNLMCDLSSGRHATSQPYNASVVNKIESIKNTIALVIQYR